MYFLRLWSEHSVIFAQQPAVLDVNGISEKFCAKQVLFMTVELSFGVANFVRLKRFLDDRQFIFTFNGSTKHVGFF